MEMECNGAPEVVRLRRYALMDAGRRCVYYRSVAETAGDARDMARLMGYDLMGLVVVDEGAASPGEQPYIEDAIEY